MASELTAANVAERHRSETSYWPILLAAALALVLVGIVVHFVLSMLGAAVFLVSLVAWTLQRFDGPFHLVRGAEVMPAPAALGVEAVAEVEADDQVITPESSRPLGWWGLVWFISSEAVFFGNLLAAYLYLRLRSETWPPAGSPHFDLLFPGLNTIILLCSGVPAFYAQRSIKKGNAAGLRLGLVLAALLGAVFLAGQGYEYARLGFRPQSNILTAGFYTLTGFHSAHVLAGICLLLAVTALSLRGRVTAKRSLAVEVAATYWHFVDIVWIFLFTALYVFQ